VRTGRGFNTIEGQIGKRIETGRRETDDDEEWDGGRDERDYLPEVGGVVREGDRLARGAVKEH
jgi:hypothetical protein